MATNYTTRTAALRATKADINKLDAKKMLLNGKNILDYISDSEFDSYDTRDPQLKNDELDIWNTGISLSEEGHIEVKPLEHSIIYNNETYSFEGMTESQYNVLKTAVKVTNNEVLGENNIHLMYWQTEGMKIGQSSFLVITDNNNLTSFDSDLSSLTDGMSMFSQTSLTSFSGDLSSLVSGFNMFYLTPLELFNSDLSSLVVGDGMFSYTSLTSFSGDLSSLTGGQRMFSNNTSLASFSCDLSSLTNGSDMFGRCTNLTTFDGNLSSLTKGYSMFYNCKLDAQSVANIVHTLPTHESNGTITIGIGCDATEADQLIFAQECDCDTWQELLDDFSAKNWTVTFQCNGRPTTTYNIRRGGTLPIYTKLEEVTDEKYAQYTSADGSKFYNINYFHSTNGSTEGYDVFSSLEEAISTYNVTPKN